MSRTKQDWALWLARHLPPGLAWLSIDPRVGRLLLGLGRVGVRADTVVATMRANAVASRTSGDVLADWEQALGLPDPDYPPTTTDDERRAEVARALAQGGTPNDALYEALAAVWGVVAEVWEPDGWAYHFWLLGPVEHVKVFRCGSGKCGEKLKWTSATWDHIERLVKRHRPSHIVVHFADAVGD